VTREGPLECVLIAEDSAHQRIAQRWTRRVVQDEVPWTHEVEWEHVLSWRQNGRRDSWKRGDVIAQMRLRSRSTLRFGSGGALEKRMFLRDLVWATLLPNSPDVVVLARDMDGKTEKRSGFEEARRDRPWSFGVVGLLPEPEAEAWFIAGFRPTDDDEHARLRACKQRLGFDPTQKPHQLTSAPGRPKEAKRVAKEILGDDQDRWERVLEAPFDQLRRIGEETGIVAFLDDIQQQVVPRLG